MPQDLPLLTLWVTNSNRPLVLGQSSVLPLSFACLRELSLGQSAPTALFQHLHSAPQLERLLLRRWCLPVDTWQATVSDFASWFQTRPPRLLQHMSLPRIPGGKVSVDEPMRLDERTTEFGTWSYDLRVADRAWRAMCTSLGDSLVDLEWTSWSCCVDSLQLLTNLRRLRTFQQYGGDDVIELPWLFRIRPRHIESPSRLSRIFLPHSCGGCFSWSHFGWKAFTVTRTTLSFKIERASSSPFGSTGSSSPQSCAQSMAWRPWPALRSTRPPSIRCWLRSLIVNRTTRERT